MYRETYVIIREPKERLFEERYRRLAAVKGSMSLFREQSFQSSLEKMDREVQTAEHRNRGEGDSRPFHHPFAGGSYEGVIVFHLLGQTLEHIVPPPLEGAAEEEKVSSGGRELAGYSLNRAF